MSAAEGRTFLDTNVLVYAFDGSVPAKQSRAIEILEASGATGRITISTQVLQEFYVTVVRKLAHPLPEADAEKAVHGFAKLRVVQIDTRSISSAIAMSRRSRISFWDALIVVSALEGGCNRLLTEDLQHGMRLGTLVVENPFAGGRDPREPPGRS